MPIDAAAADEPARALPPPPDMPGPGSAAAQLTAAQKVAVILMLLGEEEAALIVENLTPAEVERLGAAMIEVADVDRGTTSAVMDEFLEFAASRAGLGGGLDFFSATVKRALGAPRAAGILGRVRPLSERNVLPAFGWLDYRAIAQLLTEQHPQVIAATLTLIDAETAGGVLGTFDEERQVDILYRLARLDVLSEAALEMLTSCFGSLVEPGFAAAESKVAGPMLTVAILKTYPDALNKPLLAGIRARDEALGSRIEDNMLRFEDLVAMADRSMQLLVQAVDSDTLALSLRGAPAEISEKILGVMSTRAAQTVEDAIRDQGPTRKADVEAARASMIKTARSMAEAGDIMLGSGDGDVV